jgi:hypothetical protein
MQKHRSVERGRRHVYVCVYVLGMPPGPGPMATVYATRGGGGAVPPSTALAIINDGGSTAVTSAGLPTWMVVLTHSQTICQGDSLSPHSSQMQMVQSQPTRCICMEHIPQMSFMRARAASLPNPCPLHPRPQCGRCRERLPPRAPSCTLWHGAFPAARGRLQTRLDLSSRPAVGCVAHIARVVQPKYRSFRSLTHARSHPLPQCGSGRERLPPPSRT